MFEAIGKAWRNRKERAFKRQWLKDMGLLEAYVVALEKELRATYARLAAANAIIKRMREAKKI